jgi:hypothetical protein
VSRLWPSLLKASVNVQEAFVGLSKALFHLVGKVADEDKYAVHHSDDFDKVRDGLGDESEVVVVGHDHDFLMYWRSLVRLRRELR